MAFVHIGLGWRFWPDCVARARPPSHQQHFTWGGRCWAEAVAVRARAAATMRRTGRRAEPQRFVYP